MPFKSLLNGAGPHTRDGAAGNLRRSLLNGAGPHPRDGAVGNLRRSLLNGAGSHPRDGAVGNLRRSLCLAALCAVALALPAWAHHSHNNYDTTKWTPFEGTVKEVHWLLPHSWVYLEVKDTKGQPTVWALEAANPTSITENGVKREDVRPGDTIKVRCHLLRDGSSGCLLGFVTPAHGDQARGHGVEREWD